MHKINEIKNTKLERAESIIDMLRNAKQAGGGLTIKELSKRLNVCSKTISRDLHNEIHMSVMRKGNTWYLRDSINTKNSDEVILLILDEMAKRVGDDFYSKAMPFLKRISFQMNNPIYACLNAEKLNQDDIAIFQTLESAINDKIEISFMYQKDSKTKKLFCVKPLKLAFFEGFWYLLAFDISKKNEIFKKFHIKNISEITLSKNTFEINEMIKERLESAHNVWFQLGKITKVQLLINSEVAKYFLRKPLPTQILKGKHTNGDLEIQIEISHEMEIIPLIFYYLPHIKVLSPKHLQDTIVSIMTEYLDSLEMIR